MGIGSHPSAPIIPSQRSCEPRANMVRFVVDESKCVSNETNLSDKLRIGKQARLCFIGSENTRKE